MNKTPAESIRTTPHPAHEAKRLRAQARAMFSRHDHTDEFQDAEEEDLVRYNCGACRLRGYSPLADEPGMAPQPGYGSWARVYVQAGLPIPAVFREAFEDERVSENTGYAAGLATDIGTFGVKFSQQED